MSLLMQALKKAERAKQSHAADEEQPSEAFDEMLAPHEVEPATLSLSPIDAPPEPEPETPRTSRSAAFPPRAANPRQYRPALLSFDARTIRLAALAGAVLVVGAVFGYLYWRAMYGPGSSRNLSMVPMPGQDVAVPAAALPATPAPSYPTGAPAGADAAPAALPPGAMPNVPAAPPPAYVPLSDAEETRKIAQENLERAEHMDHMLNMDAGIRPPSAPQQYPAPSAAPSPYPAGSAPPPQYSLASGTPPMQAQGAPDGSANIRVAHSSTPEQVDPAVARGFAAFNSGDFASARQQYQTVLQHDANNRDALLGMAALALHAHQADQAADLYSHLLDIDPNDTDALAGLAGLRQGDLSQTEGRLRRVLAHKPDAAPLLFALGNLYAREGRWPDAQQQYFKAVAAAPENADYAFNLAVGLDRLGQGKLALNYYRRALSLNPGGAVDFDRNAAALRVRELNGQ
jgi:tetratricopeptide (TPR) repeat protein